MENQAAVVTPSLPAEPFIYIETALARLTATYRAMMLESSRTESDLVAEYLVDNADIVLDLNARAAALAPDDAETWLRIIRERVASIVRMRRPK